MKRILSTMALSLCLLPAGVEAQTAGSFDWFPGGTYDSSIPTPASFLGYAIGYDFTPHHRLKAYLEAVAAASDRVSLGSYGLTNEGRDLMLLTITSPANHARLEEIRLNMGVLADPRGVDQTELDAIIQGSPTVAWLSYSVHGSESAGTEAAILTVYQLAAGTDAVTTNILDEVVVIIDPLANPDGRERVVHSFQKRRGMTYTDNPSGWEHGSDWPGGRTNHYYFDLNRDWSWQTQVETQQRTIEYLRWNPVVHVDFHEMGGDSYFFFPAATPVHKSIPSVTMKWQGIYGEGNAEAFDQFGWPYYTKIGFDMYYPGFGDSWPSMLGAVGMTYEQGGGSSVGIEIKREDGTTHSLRQRAHGHFTASMATLKTTAERRQERMADFLAFFRHALALGDGPVSTYAFVPDTDPYNADRLVKLLTRQGIE
ncbi:MAG: zinc carboxypeptidase, partial [Chloroflexi bacterium]